MLSRVLAVAVLFGVTACGSSGHPGGASSTSRTTAGVTTPAAATRLLAVASGVPGAQLVNFYPLPGTATVKIVDARGGVHASASFVPPPAPLIGPAAALLQSPVRTAGGAVFYADNTGVIHKLLPDGSTSVVATFPLTSPQQELTYAVSPDGAHLMAIVLTLPPVHNPPPRSLGDPLYQEGAQWSLKVETPTPAVARRRRFNATSARPTPLPLKSWAGTTGVRWQPFRHTLELNRRRRRPTSLAS